MVRHADNGARIHSSAEFRKNRYFRAQPTLDGIRKEGEEMLLVVSRVSVEESLSGIECPKGLCGDSAVPNHNQRGRRDSVDAAVRGEMCCREAGEPTRDVFLIQTGERRPGEYQWVEQIAPANSPLLHGVIEWLGTQKILRKDEVTLRSVPKTQCPVAQEFPEGSGSPTVARRRDNFDIFRRSQPIHSERFGKLRSIVEPAIPAKNGTRLDPERVVLCGIAVRPLLKQVDLLVEKFILLLRGEPTERGFRP